MMTSAHDPSASPVRPSMHSPASPGPPRRAADHASSPAQGDITLRVFAAKGAIASPGALYKTVAVTAAMTASQVP